jgi:CPA2 family monovalent cation:H+ antiporter-2
MHEPFVILTLMTLGAAAMVGLLQRLNISPILGYIVLGILAGPFQEHIFSNHEQINTLAEFGIILLLFFIGLEFHLDELRANLRAFLAGGLMQTGVTTAAAAAMLRFCGLPFAAALTLGVMLALSSTALVMKAFEDKRQGDSQRARLSLAILLFQDIVAIVSVAVLPLASSAHRSATEIHPAARLALLLVILPIVFMGSRYLLPRMFQRVAAARTPESFSLLSLGACFSVALAAQAAGASLALGAFLGGLVLCRTPFASQILADLSTLRNLALGFFFITIGMLVDLKYVAAHIPALLGALVALVLLKVLITSMALRVLRIPAAVAAGVGLALAQVGEFSFVLGREAEKAHLLDAESYTFVLALAVLSMLITPFLVERSAGFGHWLGRRVEKIAHETPGTEEPTGEVTQVRAIVVGYGPVGRTLSRILKDFGIEPTIVDMNIETVKKLNDGGLKAVFGDAGRREILLAAGVEKASYLLVTLPDLPGRIPVVATARILNSSLKILTRARYIGEQPMLEESGASSIAYEEAEVAVALAGFLLKEIGAPEPEIQREAARIRAEIAVRSGFTAVMPAIRK